MKLKDIASIINPPHIKKEEEEKERYIKLISGSSIGGLVINLNEYGFGNPKKDIEKYKVVEGDILFLSKGNRFGAGIIENVAEDMIPNQLFSIIRVDKEKHNPKYITWYLQSKDVMRYLDKFTSGSTIKAVNKKILGEVEIPLPNKSKQDQFVELLENFENEKNTTLEYLKIKENLINEKIIASLKGGER